MSWPTMMPSDLRRAVSDILGRRDAEAADVWTEVRSWLVAHGAVAPDLPKEPLPYGQTDSMRDY